MKNQWEVRKISKDIKEKICELGYGKIAADILSTRNIEFNSKQEVQDFFDCNLSELQSAKKLPDIYKAKKIINSLNKESNVLIVGDYDVDGSLSTYMMYKFFNDFYKISCDFFIPSRFKHGYGLNDESVKDILSKFNKKIDLIVILDCGTSNFKEIKKLKENYGEDTKIIIIDHHIPDYSKLSANAECLINCRLNDKLAPYCTGGLVYLFCLYTSNYKIKQEDYLTYAAITTIADACHLEKNNRIIVKNGLNLLPHNNDAGLSVLLDKANVDEKNCDTEDISFKVAPMLNAPGRLETAQKVVDMLRCKKEFEAIKYVKSIIDLNEKRKQIQNEITQEAIDKIKDKNIDTTDFVLVCGENWQSGVVGIVASRLMEEYLVPSICLAKNNSDIKGSARSLNGINIKAILDECSHIFSKYGGHEMAAGVTLKKEFEDKAHEIISKKVKEYKNKNNIEKSYLYYDVEIPKENIKILNDSFCDNLFKLSPFGNGNPNVVFLVKDVHCEKVKQWKNNKGGFVYLEEVDFTFIIQEEDVEDNMSFERIDMLFMINKSFLDHEKWCGKIIDYDVKIH